jgi:hypothetical protein
LLLSGISAGVLAILLAVLVDINIHGSTAILLFVVFAGALGCVLILFIAVARFAQRNRAK